MISVSLGTTLSARNYFITQAMLDTDPVLPNPGTTTAAPYLVFLAIQAPLC